MSKKIMAMVLLVCLLGGLGSLSMNVFAYYGDPTGSNYNNYGYNDYNYSGYNCTGMRTSYSDREYEPDSWFTDSYGEEYGVLFHVYPSSPISRSDAFAPVGKAMDKAYREAGRTFSNSYGVNFIDFTWNQSLYQIAGGLYQKGIMVGYSEDNTVRLPNNITRAEFSKVVVLTAKENGISSYTSGNLNYEFEDMKDHWASQYAVQCQAIGLMNGVGNGYFNPEGLVTYQEYLAIMIRLAEKSNSSRYSIDTDDIAYGVSTTMDIDFDGYDYGYNDEFEDITIVGTRTVECSVGEYIDLKIKATPSDVELEEDDVQWEVSKSGYLRNSDTDVNGRYATQQYKALKKGTVYVTATSGYDDDIEVEFKVVITDGDDYDEDEYGTEVTSISLSPSSLNLNVGVTKQISYTVYPAKASNKGITWRSANTSVATVSSSGLITAVGVGNTTVTATAKDGSGVIATIDVTVNATSTVGNNAPIITIEGASKTYVGQEVTLKIKCVGNYTNFQVNASDIIYGSNALSMASCEKTSDNEYTVKLMAVEPGVVSATVKAGVASNNGTLSAEPEVGVDIIVFTNAKEMAEYNVG